jgi:hypothetical protein
MGIPSDLNSGLRDMEAPLSWTTCPFKGPWKHSDKEGLITAGGDRTRLSSLCVR